MGAGSNIRVLTAWALSTVLLISQGCARHPSAPPATPLATDVFAPLEKDLQRSYLELFELAPTLEYSEAQIQKMRAYLTAAQSYCVSEYRNRAARYDTELQQAAADLKKKTATMAAAERHDSHCRIQNMRILKSQSTVLASHAIPIAYQNKLAKLDLIEKWPGDLKQIKRELADGSYRQRQWGDVEDIGSRVIAPGQSDDIKTGLDAIKQMRQSGLMPKPVQNQAVLEYVNTVAQQVAAHSDLKVPLQVTVLNAKEVNAFALPGGFLYVERGLLEAADDEAELAGVMGHEIGHDVARHAHKLMVRSNIAAIFFQAAEVAAMVMTGGVAGIGTYYALQYGFYGLGLVLNLNLLGVSREFELQADKLGIQYAWNSGYDPSGFIRFFDKMATKEGYVNGMGWFNDHPPFYQRMVDAEREIRFLPKKQGLIENTTAFGRMKTELAKVTAQAHDEEKAPDQPTGAVEQGCPAPEKMEYTPGAAIETLCVPPKTQPANSQ